MHSLPTLHIVSSVYMLLSCNQMMMMLYPYLSWSCVVLPPEAKRLPQVMMASPTLCFVSCNNFQGILYCTSTIFASATVVYLKPGLGTV